jgi:carboxypeptidase PM20D1
VLDEGSSIMNEPYPGVNKPVAFISNAEKGYLSLELTAHGEGGHAARPSRDLALRGFPTLSSMSSVVRLKPISTRFSGRSLQRSLRWRLSVRNLFWPICGR